MFVSCSKKYRCTQMLQILVGVRCLSFVEVMMIQLEKHSLNDSATNQWLVIAKDPSFCGLLTSHCSHRRSKETIESEFWPLLRRSTGRLAYKLRRGAQIQVKGWGLSRGENFLRNTSHRIHVWYISLTFICIYILVVDLSILIKYLSNCRDYPHFP